MKNFFVLCLMALLTVSLGATATPYLVDTSPIVVVDDYTPDLPSVNCAINAPESPNIGFIRSYADTNIVTYKLTTSPNSDPTDGKSAECSSTNGANDVISTVTTSTPDGGGGNPCTLSVSKNSTK